MRGQDFEGFRFRRCGVWDSGLRASLQTGSSGFCRVSKCDRRAAGIWGIALLVVEDEASIVTAFQLPYAVNPKQL